MFGFLLALAIVDGLLLGVIVLLQSGKGDGLAAMGGGGGTMADNILGGRQAATLLTKATWVTGSIFLVLLVMLSVLSSRGSRVQPLLRDQFPAPAAGQPLVPGTGTGETGTTTGEAAGEAGQTGQTPPPTTTSNQ